MSRIQEALAKVQARAAGAPPQAQRVVATAVEHAYGGRLIQVDLDLLRAQGLLAPDSHERRLADEYRIIKRPLISNASATREPVLERGNLLMVGSATVGEGKTFTCVNLALSLAREKDWTVLLIDGDCAKPHLSRLFGAAREPGLLDLLRNEQLDVSQLVMRTTVPGLSLLPAGAADEHASELLASARMTELCARLSVEDPQRIIVFDSSPLLQTTESLVLAQQVGQIVIVVRADATPQQAVVAAVAKLDQTKAVNLVLNQVVRPSGLAGYGDYSYGYGNSHYPYGGATQEAGGDPLAPR